ncbi:hypothetical protein BKA64DRAFT_100753 [Cadophora sp. MPI-SDFR-AT-0126]|nr:hypothetical protein BKA64DRAFT_100753 [Leotiomycetes sp. MPI-SDFR-AT-0126]
MHFEMKKYKLHKHHEPNLAFDVWMLLICRFALGTTTSSRLQPCHNFCSIHLGAFLNGNSCQVDVHAAKRNKSMNDPWWRSCNAVTYQQSHVPALVTACFGFSVTDSVQKCTLFSESYSILTLIKDKSSSFQFNKCSHIQPYTTSNRKRHNPHSISEYYSLPISYASINSTSYRLKCTSQSVLQTIPFPAIVNTLKRQQQISTTTTSNPIPEPWHTYQKIWGA